MVDYVYTTPYSCYYRLVLENAQKHHMEFRKKLGQKFVMRAVLFNGFCVLFAPQQTVNRFFLIYGGSSDQKAASYQLASNLIT